jgi:MtaA/CmuA family methyltransferase
LNKQIVIDAVTRDKVVPFAPMAQFTVMASIEMMKRSNAKFPEAHSDAEKMAKLGAVSFEEFGFQSVKVPFDVAVEVEALAGSKAVIDWGSMDRPVQIRDSGIKSIDQLSMPSDLANAGRIPVALEALRILKKKYPEVAVVGTVNGPVNIMSLMFGFDVILEWMMDGDERFYNGMKFCTEYSKKLLKLYEDAGADALVLGEAAASASVWGKKFYLENIASYHRTLCNDLKIPLVAHICGANAEYLPILSTLNIDGLGFDQLTSMSEANRILGRKVKKIGNIDPVGVLWKGTPELIEKEVYQCLDDGVDLLTLGCVLPLQTADENLIAFANAYKKYWTEKGIDVQ